MTVLRARGGELERDFTFGVARAALRAALSDASGGPRRTARGRRVAQRAAVRRGGGPADGGAGGEFPFLHGLHWLAANASEQAPLLLAVDDAHWSDPLSLRWLVYLLQRLDELPIALHRDRAPEEPGPQAELVLRIAHHGLTTERSLAPLSDAAVAELVRAELGRSRRGTRAPHASQRRAATRSTSATSSRPLRAGAGAPTRIELAAEPLSGAVLAGSPPCPSPHRRSPRRSLSSGAALRWSEPPRSQASKPTMPRRAADALAEVAILERGRPARRSSIRSSARRSTPTCREARRARAHARAAELLRDGGADPEQVAIPPRRGRRRGRRMGGPGLRRCRRAG